MFEHANALVAMWDAFDQSERGPSGCKLAPGAPATLAFARALEVVLAMARITEQALGIDVDYSHD